MDPVTTGIATGAAGTLVNTMLNGGRKPKAPDIRPLVDTINQGAERQGQITNALPGQLKPIEDKFGTDTKGAEDARAGELKTLGSGLVHDIGDTSGAAAKGLADALKQRVLSAQPDLQDSLRESLASTGQLHGGAGVAGFTKLATNAAADISSGNRDIALKTLEQKADALKTAYGQNAQMVHNTLGIDANTFKALMDSGREDLITQAHDLIQQSQNQTGQLLQANQVGQNRTAAYDLGNEASRNDQNAALMEILGRVAGGVASRK